LITTRWWPAVRATRPGRCWESGPPRPEAQAALAGLRGEGIERLVMLTADNTSTARSVSRAVGIFIYARLYEYDDCVEL
jgi:cation transport ATPase